MTASSIKWGSLILVLLFIFLWIIVYIERPREKSGDIEVVEKAVSSDSEVYEVAGARVIYPKEYTLKTSDEDSIFSEGASLMVPESLTKDTNLSANSRVYIQVQQNVESCSAKNFVPKEFLPAPVATSTSASSSESIDKEQETQVTTLKFKKQMVGLNTFDTVSFADAGAGNFYEQYVYAIGDTSSCYGITQFIHSLNILNYEPGKVTEFDREQFDEDVEDILRDFTIL